MFDFFISDTHFGHKAIINLCARPFNSVEEMNEAIIANFNSVVGKNDRVLWCGDVSFTNKVNTKAIFDRLNGRSFLVCGNHEPSATWMLDVGFEAVTKSITFRMEEYKFLACHFPYQKYIDERHDLRFIDSYPTKGGEDFLLHGHTHSLTKVCGTMIHVGVDAWDFMPVARDRILSIARE